MYGGMYVWLYVYMVVCMYGGRGMYAWEYVCMVVGVCMVVCIYGGMYVWW